MKPSNSTAEIIPLEYKSYELRKKLIELTGKIGGAHIGGSFSQMEIMVALYYYYLNIDPKNPKKEDRDIFILSKGHTGVGYCVTLADRGFFPEAELKTFNQTGSKFSIHPDKKTTPGVEASTGSLGHGLGLGLGVAIAKRMDKRSERVVVLLGDGEIAEGSNWEAILSAAHFKAGNLVAIVDFNKMSQDGPTKEIMNVDPLGDKFKAFGWNVLEVDGHNMRDIVRTLEKLPPTSSDKPTVIISHSVKGKGIPWMENSVTWHYGGLDTEKEKEALADLEKTYEHTIEAFSRLRTGTA